MCHHIRHHTRLPASTSPQSSVAFVPCKCYAGRMSDSTDEDFKLIKELMPLVSAETLQDFLLRYAKEYPEFKAAWRDWLKAKFMPQGTRPDDIRASVRSMFNSAPTQPGSGNQWCDDFQDWCVLGDSMLRLIENLQGLPLGTRLAFAFEFLRQLDAYNDLDLGDEGWQEMQNAVDSAHEMIRDYIGSKEVSNADKQTALDELADIAALPLYHQVGLFSLDAMLLELRIVVMNPDEALQMLDRKIEGAEGYRKEQFVERKYALLLDLKRNDEAEALLFKFRSLYYIRRRLVETLVDAGRYEEGMDLLDEAIREESRTSSYASDSWRELQFSYAVKHKDANRLEPLLRTLFCNSGGNIKYYHALKEQIPAERQQKLLQLLLSNVRKSYIYNNYDVAEIYLLENQPQRVVEVMPDQFMERMDFICRFAPRLQDISAMLRQFAEDAREHARCCVNRKAYKELVRYLDRIFPLPGGRECVQALVSEFRTQYRNRSAMMDELKRF